MPATLSLAEHQRRLIPTRLAPLKALVGHLLPFANVYFRVEVPTKRGDALLMRPLVLHASSKSSGSSLRRVLHFVFGPEVLPYGLAW